MKENRMIRRSLAQTLSLAVALLALPSGGIAQQADSTTINVGNRLEVMVDDHLIDSFTGNARLAMHRPVARDIAIKFDMPWEGSGSAYVTVFKDGDRYRMYYRGANYLIKNDKLIQTHPQVTCYAESKDGITWLKPKLGLFEWEGSKENNIIWTQGQTTHNFTPFKDTRPGVPKNEQYKALAYLPTRGKGLAAFGSPDGLKWRLLKETPVLVDGKFDSQNLAFWDQERGEYRAYYRDFRKGYRDIRTATTKDFLNWPKGQWLDYPDSPRTHLYTNQITPYYRAPHLFIGFPMRYVDRGWSDSLKELPDYEQRQLRARDRSRYGSAITDTLLMTSRDGQTFHRFQEAFIRPGPQRPGTWNYGHLSTAWGLLETAPPIEGQPNELSLYVAEGGWSEDEKLRRYTLRIDGFASVHASVPGGEFRTKSLTFNGKELVLNLATSAGGFVKVAIHDADDKPIQGFGIDDCLPIFGDSLDRTVTWKAGSDISRLANQPMRLRFVMQDADLYSLRFR